MTSNDDVLTPTFLYNEEMPSYSKLVVPSSMRSPLWKHFGFPADKDNNIITKKKIVCCVCHIFIAYNKNTTNLSSHLTTKHSEIMLKQYPDMFVKKGAKRRKSCDDGHKETLKSAKQIKSNESSDEMETVQWLIEDHDDGHSGGTQDDGNAVKNNTLISESYTGITLNKPTSKNVNQTEKVLLPQSESESEFIEPLDYECDEYQDSSENEQISIIKSENVTRQMFTNEFLSDEFLTNNINSTVNKEKTISTKKFKKLAKSDFESNLIQEQMIRSNVNQPSSQNTELVNYLKNFVVKDLVSPKIIDGNGFKALIHNLMQKENIPSSSEVRLLYNQIGLSLVYLIYFFTDRNVNQSGLRAKSFGIYDRYKNKARRSKIFNRFE